MNIKQLTLPGINIILFAIAFYPALKILVEKWMSSDEYTHAFIVFPLICYMAWKKRQLLQNISQKYSAIGLLVILISAFLYYFALLTEVHTIILFAMYCTVIGISIYILGLRSLMVMATPFLLLLLLIPMPEQLYTLLTFPLQLKVSEISELILRMFHIPMLREGNVMKIPGMSFEVIEACSGLRSMIALLTLSILMGSFAVTLFRSKFILVLASIPLAIFVNILRVVSMILLYHLFSFDLTEGIWHTASGLMVFATAIVTLIFLQKALELWEQKTIQKT